VRRALRELRSGARAGRPWRLSMVRFACHAEGAGRPWRLSMVRFACHAEVQLPPRRHPRACPEGPRVQHMPNVGNERMDGSTAHVQRMLSSMTPRMTGVCDWRSQRAYAADRPAWARHAPTGRLAGVRVGWRNSKVGARAPKRCVLVLVRQPFGARVGCVPCRRSDTHRGAHWSRPGVLRLGNFVRTVRGCARLATKRRAPSRWASVRLLPVPAQLRSMAPICEGATPRVRHRDGSASASTGHHSCPAFAAQLLRPRWAGVGEVCGKV